VVGLDFRTVFIGNLLSTALSAAALTFLWVKNRQQSRGTGFWAAHVWVHLLGLLLILLRGVVPDVVSMAVASTLVIGALLLLTIGFERYLDAPRTHVHDVAYLAVFFLIHGYFSVVQPNLMVRNINSSVGITVMCLQLVWLLSRRVAPDVRKDARMASAIFGAYVLISVARIGLDLSTPANQDFFRSGFYDALVFLSFQILQIGLTLSIILLVNRRLQSALERDIAGRTLTEAALKLSEQKFSTAFENIPDAIVVTALTSGRIIDVNEGFQRISEYSKSEAIGRTAEELGLWAEPSDRAGLVEAIKAGGSVVGAEATFSSKAGRIIEAVVSASIIEIDEEQCILTVIHDATESKQAQVALARSEEKFFTAFQTSPDAVNINRLTDGVYLDVNDGFTKLTGYSAEDVIGVASGQIHIWEDPEDRERLVAGLTSDGVVHNLEARFRRKDGMVTTALMSAQLIDVDGERCILSVTRDITDRRAAEEALRESEEKYRTLTEGLSDVVWTLDPKTLRFLYVSPSVERLRGFTPEEILAEPIDAALMPEAVVAVRSLIDRRVEDLLSGTAPPERSYTEVVEQPRKDGSTVWTEVVTSYRLSDRTGLPEIHGVTRDITRRKQAEDEIVRLNEGLEQRVQARTEELTAMNEELIEANIRLDEATRAKSDFLASMSHELRTPLNSIIGFSDILVRGMAGELEPEQAKQIRMINASGRHLLELVNEVLDLSAIEVGQMRIELGPVDVPDVVGTVVESLAPLATRKELDLSWSVAADAASFVSDRRRIEQVLINLVGNAIKFTDAGSIRIDVRRASDEMLFTITDTGRGIAGEHLSRVFEDFYQVERHDVAKSEGTGLGLTVSRRLVDMLGGTIDVESTPGVGSVFTIRLPVGEQ